MCVKMRHRAAHHLPNHDIGGAWCLLDNTRVVGAIDVIVQISADKCQMWQPIATYVGMLASCIPRTVTVTEEAMR